MRNKKTMIGGHVFKIENMHRAIRIRRVAALSRLEEQLKRNNKNTKQGVVELSEKDIKRINKEIEVLKAKT